MQELSGTHSHMISMDVSRGSLMPLVGLQCVLHTLLTRQFLFGHTHTWLLAISGLYHCTDELIMGNLPRDANMGSATSYTCMSCHISLLSTYEKI